MWQINRLKYEIESADAIVVGAGAGMSASAGLTYSGERFEKHFADFRNVQLQKPNAVAVYRLPITKNTELFPKQL